MLLVAALVSSCVRSEVDTPNAESGDTTGQISFGSAADWTRGEVINSVSSLSLYSIFSYKKWTDAVAADMLPFFTGDYKSTLALTSTDGSALSYSGGPHYWPTGDSEYLHFYAIHPTTELDIAFDENSGKPAFNYTMSEWSQDNEDIIFDAQFDMTQADSNSGTVNFDLQHLLTRLSLEVQLSGSASDGYGIIDGEDTNEYKVNGITFYGLYNNATLNIDLANDGSRVLTWDVDADNTSTIDLTATQGYSVESVDTAAALTTTNFTDVMAEGKSIFVLPQSLTAKRTALEEDGGDAGTAPTVQIRIRRSYQASASSDERTNIIYASQTITVPPSSGSDGWEPGQWNRLQFTFNLDELDDYDTPLTLFSQIYAWTDTTVDVDVSPNVYIYSSANEIEVENGATTADMCFYTNYQYDLRRHKRKVELDGVSYTEATGFTFYTVSGDSDAGPYDPIVVYRGVEYEYVYEANADGGYDLYLENSDTDVKTLIVQVDGIADLSAFEYTKSEDIDGDGIEEEISWMDFKIKPYDTELYEDVDMSSYDFTYSVAKTTRAEAGLYVNTSVENESYGINKADDDSVYILRLNINQSHMTDNTFVGKIGAEMISNGGGLVTYKFPITLTMKTE